MMVPPDMGQPHPVQDHLKRLASVIFAFFIPAAWQDLPPNSSGTPYYTRTRKRGRKLLLREGPLVHVPAGRYR